MFRAVVRFHTINAGVSTRCFAITGSNRLPAHVASFSHIFAPRRFSSTPFQNTDNIFLHKGVVKFGQLLQQPSRRFSTHSPTLKPAQSSTSTTPDKYTRNHLLKFLSILGASALLWFASILSLDSQHSAKAESSHDGKQHNHDSSSNNNSSNLSPSIQLYQYQVCPFCCKVRAFLQYNKIPFQIVEVNPVLKSELKQVSSYRKVPLLFLDGQELQGSNDIILQLNSNLASRGVLTSENVPSVEELKWMKWADTNLVILLPPNIYRSWDEALDAFSYITTKGYFPAYIRAFSKYTGAAAMYMVAKKKKKEYKITDERAALYDALNTWQSAIGDKAFHGGSSPNLADLVVFGVLSSIKGLSAWGDCRSNTRIGEWFDRMESVVGPVIDKPMARK